MNTWRGPVYVPTDDKIMADCHRMLERFPRFIGKSLTARIAAKHIERMLARRVI